MPIKSSLLSLLPKNSVGGRRGTEARSPSTDKTAAAAVDSERPVRNADGSVNDQIPARSDSSAHHHSSRSASYEITPTTESPSAEHIFQFEWDEEAAARSAARGNPAGQRPQECTRSLSLVSSACCVLLSGERNKGSRCVHGASTRALLGRCGERLQRETQPARRPDATLQRLATPLEPQRVRASVAQRGLRQPGVHQPNERGGVPRDGIGSQHEAGPSIHFEESAGVVGNCART
jgi:hypothetical protein